MSEAPNLPMTVKDFKIGLGRELAGGGREIIHGSNIPAWAINRPTDKEYTAAAEEWREYHEDKLASLAQMIKRALPYLPEDKDGALNSLMSDDWSDTFGIRNFMVTVEPSYVRNVYIKAFTAEPTIMKISLETLAEFCEGK